MWRTSSFQTKEIEKLLSALPSHSLSLIISLSFSGRVFLLKSEIHLHIRQSSLYFFYYLYILTLIYSSPSRRLNTLLNNHIAGRNILSLTQPLQNGMISGRRRKIREITKSINNGHFFFYIYAYSQKSSGSSVVGVGVEKKSLLYLLILFFRVFRVSWKAKGSRT